MGEPNPISELLNTTIPERLWHYTSVSGFQGIVTSKTVFASDLHFLNDREELIHAQRIAAELVAKSNELGSNQFPEKWSLENAFKLAFNAGPLAPSRLQVFVASFSAAEDQLSQWRGYSGRATGVSIGFDLRELRPPASADTFVTFAPCVYDVHKQKELIRFALDHFVREAQGYWDENVQLGKMVQKPDSDEAIRRIVQERPDLGSRLREGSIRTSADLLRIAALLKNPSFHEEKEWRLVLPIVVGKKLANPPRFRAANTTLIPYIAHPFSTDGGRLPVVDLLLGPGSHPNAVLAAHAFLRSEGIMVMPRFSLVPFRDG